MGPRPVVWKHLGWGEQGYGIEHLLLQSRRADSVLVWVDERDRACRLMYAASWDERWGFERIALDVQADGGKAGLDLRRDPDGQWLMNDQPAAELARCREVDLWPSPFTNTFPVRRLDLAVGASATISVAWIEAPELVVRARDQRYTNLGAGVFRFESLDDGFSADVEVDDAGLVVRYPELFERLV